LRIAPLGTVPIEGIMPPRLSDQQLDATNRRLIEACRRTRG
jgi:hypothetical protein